MTTAFGPLVELECRRALGRGWLILFRTLTAVAIFTVAMIALWYADICVAADPSHLPFIELRTGLVAVEGVLVTFALVLAPAIMAGSLAGEKERGALGLLLTTRVTPREVVLGRFAGKLSQLAMILFAGLPAVVLLGPLTGSTPGITGLLLLLPLAVGFGSGGLALAVSAVSRRGRDALLSVYLLDLVFLLIPLADSLGVGLGPFERLTVLNPYTCLGGLIWKEQVDETWLSIGLWSGMGMLGLGVASWRLAPACLAQLDGARIGRVRLGRRRRVPALGDRPMVWKELYVESAGKLGGLGWWVGAGLSLLLVGGSLAMAGGMLWERWRGQDLGWSTWGRTMLGTGVGGSAMFVAWLIEWAIGLRAAVTIASERERGTWDAILTSPLEAREIIRAKLWGSLYALRWLFAAALLAWTVTVVATAMTPSDYFSLVIGTLATGAFMAAVGIRTSLSATTATRAMAMTIGIWLGALFLFSILSFILKAITWITVLFALTLLAEPAPVNALNTPMIRHLMDVVELATTNAPYLVVTLLLVSLTSLRFDRLAGRSAGGRFAVATDQFLRQSEREWGASMMATTSSTNSIDGTPQHTSVLESSTPAEPEVSPQG